MKLRLFTFILDIAIIAICVYNVIAVDSAFSRALSLILIVLMLRFIPYDWRAYREYHKD